MRSEHGGDAVGEYNSSKAAGDIVDNVFHCAAQPCGRSVGGGALGIALIRFITLRYTLSVQH